MQESRNPRIGAEHDLGSTGSSHSLSHCSSVDKGLARPTVGSAVPARMVSNKISAQQLHKHAATLHWTEIPFMWFKFKEES